MALRVPWEHDALWWELRALEEVVQVWERAGRQGWEEVQRAVDLGEGWAAEWRGRLEAGLEAAKQAEKEARQRASRARRRWWAEQPARKAAAERARAEELAAFEKECEEECCISLEDLEEDLAILREPEAEESPGKRRRHRS